MGAVLTCNEKDGGEGRQGGRKDTKALIPQQSGKTGLISKNTVKIPFSFL